MYLFVLRFLFIRIFFWFILKKIIIIKLNFSKQWHIGFQLKFKLIFFITEKVFNYLSSYFRVY